MELDTNYIASKQNKQEIVAKQQQQREEHFLGKAKHIEGLTWFSFNTKTKAIKKVPILESSKTYDICKKEATQNRRIQVEESCIYCQALNIKNAKKHVAKKFHIDVKDIIG